MVHGASPPSNELRDLGNVMAPWPKTGVSAERRTAARAMTILKRRLRMGHERARGAVVASFKGLVKIGNVELPSCEKA